MFPTYINRLQKISVQTGKIQLGSHFYVVQLFIYKIQTGSNERAAATYKLKIT